MVNINKEIYKRFIIPFYIPLLALLPFFLTLSSKENLNYLRFKVITFFLGLFFIILSETTIKMISEIILNNLIISAALYAAMPPVTHKRTCLLANCFILNLIILQIGFKEV